MSSSNALSAETLTIHPVEKTIPTRRISSLRLNSIWVLLGSLADFLGQGLLFVLLSRWTNPTTVGYFAYALAFTSPVFMLSGLQLRQIYLTDVHARYRLADVSLVRLICIAIALLWCGLLTTSIQNEQILWSVLGCLWFKVVDSIAELWLMRFQQQGQFGISAQQQIFRAAGIIGLGSFAVWQLGTAGAVWLGAGTGSLLATVLFQLSRRAAVASDESPKAPGLLSSLIAIRPSWNLLAARGLVVRGLPLGLVMMLLSLLTTIPRLFIENQLGAAALGLFSAAGYVTSGGMMLVSATCQPAVAELARYYARGETANYWRLIQKLVGLGGGLGILLVMGAWLAGDEILGLLFGNAFSDQRDVLVWQLAAAGVAFVTAGLGTAVTAAQRFASQVLVMVLTIVVCAMACWWLVPLYGLPGAAAGSLVAWSFCCAGYACILPRR